MILYGEFPYDPQDRIAFAKGRLRESWFTAYPMLFETSDRLQAEHQPRAHFFEWLAAIRIYEDTGFLSLVEKYQFRRKHPRKYAIFSRLVPSSVARLLADSHFFGSRQGPDLFEYAPDETDWFFCEVKGVPDKVRDTQSTLFATLERMTAKPVRLIRYLPTLLPPQIEDGA